MEEAQVSAYTSGAQNRPAIWQDADGDIAVVWQSGDTGTASIQGQHFRATGRTVSFIVAIDVLDTTIDAGFAVLPSALPIFRDCFEINNTTRWSTTVLSPAHPSNRTPLASPGEGPEWIGIPIVDRLEE